MHAVRYNGELYFHLSWGRVIDELAGRFEKVMLSVPLKDGKPNETRDYILKAKNIEIISQPFYNSAIGSLRHMPGIIRSYIRLCRKSDILFFRGMAAFVGVLYLIAWLNRVDTCHWIVGNPVALLRTHNRAGKLMDTLSLAYALQDRIFTKLGRWLVGGAFVCNGEELAGIYKSRRTKTVVSSTITADEFHKREDTCQGHKIRILFIGFIRPEKGVEYLIEALGKLEIASDWELTIIGTYGKYSNYKNKIESLTNRYNITDKINVAGYVPYGPKMFEYFRKADIFVLPTLSEGTPRVLVEARANSLPVISTNVGGIPTSVTDGFDGLLVTPKNDIAMARAIKRVVEDGELRRFLIANGLKTALKMTVDHFVELVFNLMENSRENQ